MVTNANKEIILKLFLNSRDYSHHYTSLGTQTFQFTSQIYSESYRKFKKISITNTASSQTQLYSQGVYNCDVIIIYQYVIDKK